MSLSYIEKCQSILNNSDLESDGFIQYSEFIYCQMPENLLWLGMVILVIWLIILFLGLSIAADSFFCPSLAVIVDHLHLSHNIAGVTFLAFGNGAPDIFAALASVLNSQNQSAGLAFGALLGAAMFLSTIIVGIVTLIRPFHVMERPLLRDLIFYLATLYWTFYILYKGEIRLLDSLGFLLLYIVYVTVVVITRYINTRIQARKKLFTTKQLESSLESPTDEEPPKPIADSHCGPLTLSTDSEEAMAYDLFFVHRGRATSTIVAPIVKENDEIFTLESIRKARNESATIKIKKSRDGAIKELLAALAPFTAEDWSTARWYSRILIVIKAPILVLLTITVPVVDPDKPNNNWSFILTLFHCLFCPIFAIAALQYVDFYIASVFPVELLALIVGAVLAILIGCTSKPGHPPVYHKFLAYFGFVMAVIWIYCLANEVVSILLTFGIVLDLSNEILGLTILAWSNSLGDLVSDITVATKGYPRMAISACFGGPLFNILVGIGLPFTIATIRQGGQPLVVETSSVAQILMIFTGVSIVSSFLILPLCRFRASRPYAIFLLILYISFLTLAILTESKLIPQVWN